MLSKVGDGVDRGRIPFLGKRMQRRTESPRVVGHPAPRHAPPAGRGGRSPTGLLVALAIPALGMHTASSGIEQLPADADHEDASKMQKAFPGGEAPEQVVIEAKDVTHARGQGRDRGPEGPALRHATASTPASASTTARTTGRRGRAADRAARATTAKSYAALENSARTSSPRRSASSKGAEVVVGGNAAQSKDYNDLVKGSRPDRVRVRPHARVPAAAWSRSARSSSRSRRSC